MLATADNELITKTGPGTPMGEVFRRYWQPVALSEEIATPGGKPGQLKVMREDRVLTQPKLDVSLQETEYGVWRRSSGKGSRVPSYGHFFMPGGFMGIRVTAEVSPIDGAKGAVRKLQSWYVPVDDEHCKRFIAAFVSLSQTNGAAIDLGESREAILNLALPGPENEYFRDYEAVDTISGIPLRTAHDMGSLKGYLAQDSMVNETQGPIADRSLEHLGVGDRLLIMTRKQLRQAVEDVSNGLDPRFSQPQPDDEGLVRVGGNDEIEVV